MTRAGLDLDSEEVRRAAALAADAAVDRLRDYQGRIIPENLPETLLRLLELSLPEEGVGLEGVTQEIRDHVYPAATRTTDPRFLGLITSPGNPYGVMAGALLGPINQHVTRGYICPAAAAIEDQTVRWIGAFIGYDENAAGTFTGGGSTANLMGIAAACRAKAPFDVAELGFSGGPGLGLYTSQQAHFSIEKAVDMLGVGRSSLRKIGVHSDLTIDVDALEKAIIADRARAIVPAVVIANAGTVNSGAVDPLGDLADLCARHDLWLHVDAAYGGPAAGTALAGHLFRGIDRAHSVTVDAHKWFYTPYEGACLLVHDAALLRSAFSFTAPYAATSQNATDHMDLGLHMSRDFKALKLWALLRGAGAAAVRAAIEDDIRVIHALARRIDSHPRFELAADTPLSIVCFRYLPARVEDAPAIDAFNLALAESIFHDGRVFLTSTKLGERICLRACCVNYRLTHEIAEEILAVIDELGQKLETSGAGGAASA
jgi:aromatic-L-amino-acid decarboxylase